MRCKGFCEKQVATNRFSDVQTGDMTTEDYEMAMNETTGTSEDPETTTDSGDYYDYY